MARDSAWRGLAFKGLMETARGMRRAQVAVAGYNADTCTKEAYEAAYRVGRAVAAKGGVVVCGGLGGVMEAACKGAREAGGTALGILPSAELGDANAYCDLVVATGLGHGRNFLVAYSGDAMVVVGGGAGTLIEAAAAHQAGKTVVTVRGTGGMADELVGRRLDSRRASRILGGSSPEDAVEKAMRGLKRKA
jgi:uncharacterized protein (TIGR00725 family)